MSVSVHLSMRKSGEGRKLQVGCLSIIGDDEAEMSKAEPDLGRSISILATF